MQTLLRAARRVIRCRIEGNPGSAPAATAAVAQAPQAPKKGGKKSMLMLIVVAVVMLGGGAGGAWFYLQKRAAAAAAAADEEPAAHAPAEKHAPTYLPLESMVVNLADGGGERFAQIGVTLDIENEKTAAKIKTYMPAIRSAVLLLVSQRTSEELLKRDGKEKLANDIVAEVSRALGYEVDEPAPKATKVKTNADAEAQDQEPAPKRKKARKVEPSPINGVLFSSFIVQ